MDVIHRVVRIGTAKFSEKACASVFCNIKYYDGKLTISGVHGPLPSGNANGSSGQIILSELEWVNFASGWNKQMVSKLEAIWDQYHLNDMQTGSPDQTAYVRDNNLSTDYNYNTVVKKLEEAGLNPDPNFLYNDKPYHYGSAWLTITVPESVLQWILNLPEADRQPAWV